MQKILVKIHNAKQTIAEAVVVTKDGTPTTIKASKRVNYELIDESTGHAPHHIITKRVGQDLHVSFEENGQESDLIIEGFYDAGETALVGLAEDGQYYYYVPDTGNIADYVTELLAGDVEGQALGGTAYPTPWWIGASDGVAGFVPWLVGLAGIGAVIGLTRDKKSTPVDTTAPEAPVVTATDTKVTVTPASDAISTTVTYKDHTGQDVTKTFTKDPNTGKWTDGDTNDSISIDETTGVVSIPVTNVADKTSVVATTKDGAGNSSQGSATTLDIPPSKPVLTAENHGDVIIGLPQDADVGDKVIVTIPHEDGTNSTVTLTKTDTGWTSDNPVVTLTADTNTATIKEPDVKDGGTVTAVATTADGKVGVDAPVSVIAKDSVPEPAIAANTDGSVTINLVDRKNPNASPDEVSGEYTDPNGNLQVFVVKKDPATNQYQQDPANINDKVTVDPATGTVTIAAGEVGSGKEAKASQTFGNDVSSFATTTVLSASLAKKPKVTALEDGSATIETSDDTATELTASYKDETGASKTVTVIKDPSTGKWAQDPANVNNKVTIDESTGKITIPADEVKDGSLVTGTQTVPTSPQKGEEVAIVNNATGTHPVVPEPDVTNNNDGSVSITPTTNDTPAKNATSATATYTDEAGNPQTITITKGEDGTWTKDPANTNDKVTVDPTTGTITIPASEVKDGSIVTATQSTPIGDSIASNVAKDGIPEPEVKANDNGSVTITPAKDATSLTIEFNDEDNALNPVKVEKQGNEWVSTNPSVQVDKDTGVVTIPADKLKDGSEVVANQTTPQGVSGDATDRVKAFDHTDKPTITTEDGDKPVTVKPGEDNSKVTVDYTDETGNPQTITVTKDPATNTWTATDSNGNPISTSPTTDDKTPYVDPTTGEVTLPKDSVDNSQPVTVVGEKEGADKTTVTTSPDQTPPAKPTLTANNDGSVSVTPPTDADVKEVTVSVTDPETNTPKEVTLTKNDDGSWTSDDPTTVPHIPAGQTSSTIPADKVKDGSPVVATAEDQAGNKTDPVTTTAGTGGDDKTPPTLTSAEVPTTGDKVVLTFDEPLDSANPPKPADFSVTVDGKPVTPTAVSVAGNEVTLTLPEKVEQDKPVSVSYNDPTTNNDPAAIQDKAGNDAASIKDSPVENKSSDDQTPPAKPTLTANNDGSVSVTPPTDADVKEVTVSVTDPETNTPKEVTLTKNDDGSWTSDDPTTVPHIPAGQTSSTIPADKVKDGSPVVATAEDQAGNKTDPVTTTAGTGGDDKTPPTLTSATVPTTGDKVVLTFDEPLDSANPPKPADFSVTVDGKPVTPTAVSVAGNEVTLTLPEKVEQDKPVSVSYNDPTTNNDPAAIQDKAGNDAASIKDSPVENKSSDDQTPPAKPTLTANNDGSVSVTPPTDADVKEVTVSVTDPETNTPKEVTLTKNDDGSWTSDDPTTVPHIPAGQTSSTIPADKVKDGSPVVATAEDQAGNKTDPVTTTAGTGGDDKTPPTLTSATVPTTGDKVVLTFDEPLDSANPPKPADFSVTVDGKPVTPTAVSVAGNEVTLTLPEKVEQDKPVSVSYNDPTTNNDPAAIQDKAGNDAASIKDSPVENKSSDDQTPPAKPTLTANNDGSVSVTPPTDADVKEVTVSVTDPETNTPKEVTLTKNDDGSWTSDDPTTVPHIPAGQTSSTIPADKVKDGSPVVATAEDQAGNKTDPVTTTAGTGGDDKTPPTLTSATVPTTGDKVVLTFDEPLDSANPPKPADFSVTVDGKPVTPTAVSVAGNEVTLTLPEKVEQDKPVSVSYNDPTTNNDPAAIQDKAGNDAASIKDSPVENKSSDDQTPPAKPTLTANNDGSVSVTPPTDADVKEVTVSVTDPETNTPKEVTLTKNDDGSWTSDDPTTVPHIPAGQTSSTIPADKVKDGSPVVATAEDKAGNKTDPVTTTAGTGGDDKTPPTLTSATVPTTGDKVVLTFDEPLDSANPPKPADFSVTVDGKPVTPTAVSVAGNEVTLTLPEKVEQDKPVSVSYNDPTTNNDPAAIQDKAGNDAASIKDSPVENKSSDDQTPPAKPTLTANNDGSVSVTPPTDADVKEVTVSVTDPETNTPKEVTLTKNDDGSWTSDDPTTVPHIPAGQTSSTIPADKVKDGSPVVATAEDQAGNKTDPVTTTAGTGGDDKTPPTLTSAEVPTTGDKVVLTFDEPLDSANPPKPADFSVTVDGKPVTPTAVSVAGNEVTLTLPEKVEQDKPVSVSYNDPTTNNDPAAIQDKAGNDAASIKDSPVENKSSDDQTPPAKPTLTANNDGSVSVTPPTDADVKEVTVSVTDPETNTPKEVTLTKNDDGSWTSDDPTTVPHIPAGQTSSTIPADKVKDGSPVVATAEDKAGNKTDPVTTTAGTGGDDKTPPTLTSAEVPTTGDKVVLTFDEPLDSANPPKPADFSVTVDGKPVTPTAVSVAGNEVTLTLPEKVEQDKPVSVSYNDPTTNNDPAAIQDKAGNDAASIKDSPVENKSSDDQTPPAKPTLTANNDGSVSVTPPTDADVKEVTVSVTDPETNTPKEVTLTKNDDGSWTSDDPTTVPHIPAGQTSSTIPADKVKDGSPVVATAEDQAGNKTDPVTTTAGTGGDDKTPPTLTSAEVPTTGDKVVLTFDEPLDSANPPKPADFSVTVDGKPVTPTAVSVAGNEVTLTLPEKVEQDKPVSVSYNDPTTNNDPAAIQDKAGNDAASIKDSPVENKSSDDQTPPAKPTLTANNDGSVSVTPPTDADVKEVTVSVTDPETNTPKEVTLTKNDDGSWTSDDPTTVPHIPAGQTSSTIPADKVKDGSPVVATAEDQAGNKTDPVTTTAGTGGDDKTPPTLTSAEVPTTGDKVVLTFDEPLDSANPPKPADFSVTVDGKPVTPTAVSVAGNEVTLTLPEKVEQDKPVSVSYNDPTTNNDPAAIQDKAGNDAASIKDSPVENKSSDDQTPPAKPTLTANNDGSVSVTPPTDADVKEVTVSVTDPETNTPKEVTLTKNDDGSWTSDDPTTVPHIPAGQTSSTIPADKVKDGSPVVATAEDQAGNKTDPVTTTAGTGGDDKTPPTLTSATVPTTGDKVVLTFDEPLDSANPPKPADFSVTVDGKPVTPTAVSVAGNEVTLTLPEKVEQDKPVSVSYNDPTTNNDPAAIQDKAGNDAASIKDSPVENKSSDDQTPPAKPTLTANNDGSVSVTPPTDADVKEVTVSVTDPETNTPKEVTLTKNDDGSWTSDDPTTVPHIPAGQTSSTIPADKVKDGSPVVATAEDQAGNKTDPVTTTAGTGGDDKTPPTLTSATVPTTGDKVVLTFDEPLDSANPPKPADFSVTVDGKPVTPTAVSVAGNEVTLTLPEKVEQDKPVSVSYNDPTTNNDPAAIQDKAGNDAASIKDSPVENKSSDDQTPPAKPTLTANNDGSVSVTPPTDADVKEVTVSVTDPETNTPKEVTLTKNDDGSWTSDDPTTVPHIPAGQTSSTIPADKVKDGSPVVATAEDQAGNKTDPVTTTAGTGGDPKIDPATITPNNDGSVTVTPGENNTKLTITYIDETSSVRGAEGKVGEKVTFTDSTPTGQKGENEPSSYEVTIEQNKEVTLNLVKDGDTWKPANGATLPDGVSIKDGKIEFAPNSIMGTTDIKVVAENARGQTDTQTDTAKLDTPTDTPKVYLEKVGSMSDSEKQWLTTGAGEASEGVTDDHVVINPEQHEGMAHPNYTLEYTSVATGQLVTINMVMENTTWFVVREDGSRDTIGSSEMKTAGWRIHHDTIVLPESISNDMMAGQPARLWTVDPTKGGKWQLHDTWTPALQLKLQLETDSVGAGTTGTTSDKVSNVSTVNILGNGGQAWEYRLDGGAWQDGTGTSLTLPEPTDGEKQTYQVEARLKDQTDVTTQDSFTYDKVATLDNVSFDKKGTSLIVSGHAEAGSLVTVRGTQGTAGADGKFSFELPNIDATSQKQDITVSVVDIAGNTISQDYEVRQLPNIYRRHIDELNNELDDKANVIIVGEKGALGDTGGTALSSWQAPLNFGAGDDALLTAGAVQYSNTRINMGTGNDTFRVKSYMRQGAQLDMGEGDDFVKFSDKDLGTGRDLYINNISVADNGTVINLGAGNDRMETGGAIGNGAMLNGGDGFDTLTFTEYNVRQNGGNFTGIEKIDLTGIESGNNRLDLTADHVRANADTPMEGLTYSALIIDGNAGDTVDLGDNGGTANAPRLGDFVQVNSLPTGDAILDGYRAYMVGNDMETLVLINQAITVL